MKALTIIGAALWCSVFSSAGKIRPRYGGNFFEGRDQFINPRYANAVGMSAEDFRAEKTPEGEELYKKAIQIQGHNPTWTWIDHSSKIENITENLQAIRNTGKGNIATFVIYNLPDRECGTTKPPGEFSIADDGEARYKAFIDNVVKAVSILGPLIAIIIEPAAIANLIAFKDNPKCQAADPVYKRLMAYAISMLQYSHITQYLDGGDSWTLGGDDTINATAQAFFDVYQATDKSQSLRGFSVNVGKLNLWSDPDCEGSTNGNCDEKRYINALARLLTSMGWLYPGPRFIIEQSRSGVKRSPGANRNRTCNIAGAGFGNAPGFATNDPLADTFAWVKPGGESDGTSVETSPTYDPSCNNADSLRPSPEYGEWFPEYFRQLIVNANPPIVPTS